MSLALDDIKRIKEALEKAAIKDSVVAPINRATTIVHAALHTKETVMIERLKREKDRLELALEIARERFYFGSIEEAFDQHDKLRKEINTLKSKMEACDRLIKKLREEYSRR